MPVDQRGGVDAPEEVEVLPERPGHLLTGDQTGQSDGQSRHVLPAHRPNKSTALREAANKAKVEGRKTLMVPH